MCFAAVKLLLQVKNSGILTLQIGNWAAPFGITFVADLFSSIMVLLITGLGFIIFLYSLSAIDKPREEFGYYPLLLFLLFGLTGAVLTGDVFNLFVWFEIMLMSCFVLVSLGGTRAQLEGSIKYVAVNFVASCLLLAGAGVLYGITGTLNMAHIAVMLKDLNQPGLMSVAAMFFLISFGIKSAIFPLFFWLPASYHTPPVAVSALIAGLLTKVGMYAQIRFFTLIFVHDTGFTHALLLAFSGFTMLVGVLGAAAQTDSRKILSFHIVSQIGYMLMGLALFTPLAVAGSVFFIIHNILVKTNLFLISGVVNELKGTFKLKFLGGVYAKFPFVAALFVVSAFSLAGIPPLSGFWGKFMLAKAGFEAGQPGIVAVSLLVSILTLFSMTKIWNEAFWKPDPQVLKAYEYYASEKHFFQKKAMLIIPVTLLTAFILMLGFYSEPVVSVSLQTARQLLDTQNYIDAVLHLTP